MDTKPYQMIEAATAMLQAISMAMQRGATAEVIMQAIIREGDLACKEFRIKPSSKGPDTWRTC